MSTTAVARTWTAEITVERRGRPDEVFAADLSDHDLLRHQIDAALREAAGYVREGLGDYASVEIFKETKARGREPDRSAGAVYKDVRGVVRVCR